MERSKSLIKPGDSSFSPKWLEGQPRDNYVVGVERLNRNGGPPAYPSEPNSEYHNDYLGSETVGDKLHRQEGNSPDHRLRSPNLAQCERELECRDSRDVGLEAAII